MEPLIHIGKCGVSGEVIRQIDKPIGSGRGLDQIKVYRN